MQVPSMRTKTRTGQKPKQNNTGYFPVLWQTTMYRLIGSFDALGEPAQHPNWYYDKNSQIHLNYFQILQLPPF